MNGWVRSAAALIALAVVFSASGCATAEHAKASGTERQALAEMVLGNWAGPSALAGRALLQEYGTPDDIKDDHLTWWRRGPWKRITVWEQTPHYVPDQSDASVIEEAVDYPVTSGDAERVAGFSSAVHADVERGELVSRSASEETNFLNINLADEVILGRKSNEEAQADYARILDLQAAGKTSPYTQGLLFSVER